MICEHCLFCIR